MKSARSSRSRLPSRVKSVGRGCWVRKDGARLYTWGRAGGVTGGWVCGHGCGQLAPLRPFYLGHRVHPCKPNARFRDQTPRRHRPCLLGEGTWMGRMSRMRSSQSPHSPLPLPQTMGTPGVAGRWVTGGRGGCAGEGGVGGRFRGCGYDGRGSKPGSRCPECGRAAAIVTTATKA